MKSRNALFFLCFIVLTISCSSIYDVSYEYDKEANFSSLATYYWSPKSEELVKEDPFLDRIKIAVNAELTAKGLRINPHKPDFLIVAHVKEGEEETSYPRPRKNYGMNWYLPQPEASTFQSEEGALTLDFLDAKSQELIWRGAAKAFLDPKETPEKQEKLVNEAVQKILKNFPPVS